MVREKATSISKKTARDMVKHYGSKYPPALYSVGSVVLVKRFTSKSRKNAGTKSASKASQIVEGTITDKNESHSTYKIRYSLSGREIEDWFSVSDITSLTVAEEKKKHTSNKMKVEEPRRNIDKDLLFSPSLLRLWRTGADEYIYTSEEDMDIDVCLMKLVLLYIATLQNCIVFVCLFHCSSHII